MTNLTLRKATAQDRKFAYRVKKAAFKAYVVQAYGWNEEEQQRFHEQRFEGQDFRIIHQDGMDIGVMALVTTEDCMKMNQLFLLPAYQGKGIGESCMRLIMKDARQASLPIRLGVLKVNPRARSFYQRLGFVCTGDTETHDLMEWTGR